MGFRETARPELSLLAPQLSHKCNLISRLVVRRLYDLVYEPLCGSEQAPGQDLGLEPQRTAEESFQEEVSDLGGWLVPSLLVRDEPLDGLDGPLGLEEQPDLEDLSLLGEHHVVNRLNVKGRKSLPLSLQHTHTVFTLELQDSESPALPHCSLNNSQEPRRVHPG